ncbi:MAG TPA: 2-isopropylmalate synthase [Caulobacteraceae bacterium]|jgi:2-isopropylmalate synthase|nr:2-isopropylmalate synthase [Caulobacteraceae bacterium]
MFDHPSFGPVPHDRVFIFDTTLRDGEQSPGFSMNAGEKLRMAEALAQLGVDVIEAGFPVASPDDFESVRRIAEGVKGPVICGLARAAEADIAACAEALAPAERRRVHTFISTSPLHRKHKLRMEADDVIDAITRSVRLARNRCEDVEWSAEDATRTEPDFLCRAVEAAIAAGATTINLPDTVGYATPKDIRRMFEDVRARVPAADSVIFSTHNHNDLGLAVANALAAVDAGARQIECTVSGIGERAGNASLEEAVMAMRTRRDAYPFTTGIETTRILKTARLLAAVTGFDVQPNKAIVGRNAFAHESGIHQDGMLKHAGTYEIMTPESVGWTRSNLVLGKHSGRAAFREKLKALGFDDLDEATVNAAFAAFKTVADRKKVVYEDDLLALVDETVARRQEGVRLVSLEARATSHGEPKAVVELEIDGERVCAEASGDGAVDAAFNAVRAIAPHAARLTHFSVQAVTEGCDAQARAGVRLDADGTIVDGQGADTDTVVAAVRAYVHALNKLAARQRRTAPLRAAG